ncbi:putative integral membrane protein [Brugia pahangi]
MIENNAVIRAHLQTTLLLFGCAIGSLFLLRTFGLMHYSPCIALIEILKYYTIEVFPLIFLVFSDWAFLSMQKQEETDYVTQPELNS